MRFEVAYTPKDAGKDCREWDDKRTFKSAMSHAMWLIGKGATEVFVDEYDNSDHDNLIRSWSVGASCFREIGKQEVGIWNS